MEGLIRGLWKLPDGRDWLRGKRGLVLMGGAMLSKSLIQFSVDGWTYASSLLFTWAQTTMEVMKTMVTPFKDPMHVLLHSVPPTLQQATTDPRHCWRLLDTHRQVWASLLWGSLLLPSGSWCIRFCLCPLRVYFPVLCKLWQLYGGVNGDLLKEGLCHTQVCWIPEPLSL